ncbi:Glutamate-ammonia-ligase adenylyltransferase [Thalassoglobus neptunius]|uniref:Glutamate-ammonia-ligase adenylyltransferase n=1 Tax=Thalassoglobus neptunius TaxID=1938619 RepID=A0A5C5W038_9PLAN|nr:glutamine synthetase adenylyltransferase [Thalassoglobus neptunius]TWT43535.1 Glutamate-ammonia-ligase adenylyltransferase [Thalassoglobus neptunius]
MIDANTSQLILDSDIELSEQLVEEIEPVGFERIDVAIDRLRSVPESDVQRNLLAEILPGLLFSLSETPDPDRSVLNFQRFLKSVDDRETLLRTLSREPRTVEILLRLFVGSQFLTEILVRQPDALQRLTEHKRMAEFKSREEFIEQGRSACLSAKNVNELKLKLRSFQQWELLRIAACDTFGLMDLRTVTRQLSLLADAIVQVSLEGLSQLEGYDVEHIAVIAFGKLGGAELNYSSDIDLVFVCDSHAEKYWTLGQKLINVLSEFTDLGFLYRVDMRLRPWGSSGPLVTTIDSYVDYFERHSQLWERQALLKARTIAGRYSLGDELLERLRFSAFDVEAEAVRQSIASAKAKIESKISQHGRKFGEVKSGPGGIRDIEFLVQSLQLIHGKSKPFIRTGGTIEGLIRLSEADLIHAQEYRTLSTAYMMLRTIEHSLQLMHNQAERFLPESGRELAYLARRLDFPNEDLFVEQFRQHTQAVSRIFRKHLSKENTEKAPSKVDEEDHSKSEIVSSGSDRFANVPPVSTIRRLVQEFQDSGTVAIDVREEDASSYDIYLLASNLQVNLPTICGMLFSEEFDITSADVVPLNEALSKTESTDLKLKADVRSGLFVASFRIASTQQQESDNNPQRLKNLTSQLREFIEEGRADDGRAVQSLLIRRLAKTIRQQKRAMDPILPVEVIFEQDEQSPSTILQIRAEDVPGFLYELTSAIHASGLFIDKMEVRTRGHRVFDTFYVRDGAGGDLLDEERRMQLRAAVVLIKHFTHLLPQAPHPAAALTHFRQLLDNLFQQPDWLNQLKTLENPEVLSAITQLLGVSDFLWEDFLRIQHENLFPVVTDISGLQVSYHKTDLVNELNYFLLAGDESRRIDILNEFKDRAMMRVDMRHILGLQDRFGMFSLELTSVAETVVAAALAMCEEDLQNSYGHPVNDEGVPSRLTVCALGKCGGQELGYASDIELMFIYDSEGLTTGPDQISAVDYYQRLIQTFQKSIYSRQKRIFEIDLRLRPYGNAGSLAVSREAFEKYFGLHGPAWPYERQALVKLRPIAGDTGFGEEIVQLRDNLIYIGAPFDIASMRAMREKQIRQLVQPGTFHAKLSPGGLVDCEYFVQGMQMTFGHRHPAIRLPNTREAMKGLEQAGILSIDERLSLRDAYRFLRRLIDAMRIVRGDASDLAIPAFGTDQFEFLARRLNMENLQLHEEIERHTCQVVDMVISFEDFIAR